MQFTAIVQTYYPNRVKYLDRIVTEILKAEPEELIVWNNSRRPLLIDHPKVTVIQSSRNTLLGRYAAALLSKTEYVYVQDDDVIVDPSTIQRLLKTVEAGPLEIAGIAGSALRRDSDEPYTKGMAVVGHADVVLGRAYAMRKSALSAFLRYIEDGEDPGRCDDILLSMVNSGGFVMQDPVYYNLDEEGVGLSHEEAHYRERNAFAKRLISEGY